MDAGEKYLLECAEALVDSHDRLMRDLIAMRKKHQLSQDAVAERMGVSQPTVAAFERYDANPQLSTIRRYALAVGASIEHHVEDSCSAHTAERFEEVVMGPIEARWQPTIIANWTWNVTAQPAVANAN